MDFVMTWLAKEDEIGVLLAVKSDIGQMVCGPGFGRFAAASTSSLVSSLNGGLPALPFRGLEVGFVPGRLFP